MEHSNTSAVKRRPSFIPSQDRIPFYAATATAAVIAVMGLWNLLHTSPDMVHARSFKEEFKAFGSLARIALFAVLSHYVLVAIMKRRWLTRWARVKTFIAALSRLARKWHTPVAILSLSLILLHVVGAFMYGFKPDFHSISGLLALLALLPVPLSGLFRYRRLDRQWHLRLGLAFAVLFLIHAFV
ncbi:hypothetical protein SK3146_04035 [Paenibacillus konkukensis]|uniref:Ferric oxidoreductase domain-containing protein n=1 Tax=Paenibacillus konkukensis TaxID=2020716 RepID=A0ABY4RRI0_9BACL|nr:hypothetical protein [Paenibacillus konkukensis]UQZ84780.1 hypothetical protein SK3146_04035 [Paenibacillus konkukensis]